MNRTRSILVLAVPGALWATSAWAAKSIANTPKVGFEAEGPGGLSIDGKTNQMTLREENGNLIFTVPMDSVSTGIDLRDNHMKEKYVETSKFPNVELSVPLAMLQLPADGSAESTVAGQFTAHGVTKDVNVAFKAKHVTGGWDIDARFPFNINQHGIDVPSYLGVTVDPDIVGVAKFRLGDAP